MATLLRQRREIATSVATRQLRGLSACYNLCAFVPLLSLPEQGSDFCCCRESRPLESGHRTRQPSLARTMPPRPDTTAPRGSLFSMRMRVGLARGRPPPTASGSPPGESVSSRRRQAAAADYPFLFFFPCGTVCTNKTHYLAFITGRSFFAYDPTYKHTDTQCFRKASACSSQKLSRSCQPMTPNC